MGNWWEWPGCVVKRNSYRTVGPVLLLRRGGASDSVERDDNRVPVSKDPQTIRAWQEGQLSNASSADLPSFLEESPVSPLRLAPGGGAPASEDSIFYSLFLASILHANPTTASVTACWLAAEACSSKTTLPL